MQGTGVDAFARARHLVQAGALSEARRVVLRGLVSEPASAPGLTLAGQIALRDDSLGEAVRLFGRATSAERHADPRALLNLARAQEMAGHAQQALATARRASYLFPDDERPRALVALLHLSSGRPGDAAATLRSGDAARLHPDSAYKIGSRLAGEPQYHELGITLLARAVSASGRFMTQALRELSQAARPSDRRRYDACRRLLILDPDSRDAMDAIDPWYAADRYLVKQAAWLWQSCCVERPTGKRLSRAAELTHRVQWPKHGIAANRILLGVSPGNPVLISRICDLFCRMKAEGKAEAVAWGSGIVAADLPDPRIWDAVACMYKDVEAFDEAGEVWRQAIARFPEFQVLHYNYGLYLDEQLRSEEADRRLRMAMVLKPDYVKASNLMSMVKTHVHDVDGAIRYVRWAIMSNPRHATCWVNYGTYLRAVGDYGMAMEAFAQAERYAGSDKHIEASSRYNIGMSMVTIGELEKGFSLIESRWATDGFPSPKRPFKLKIWRGPRVHPGTRLLAFMEQGMGDEVMSSWYLPLLRRDTERLLVDCDPRLVALFERTYEGVEFVPRTIRGHEKTRDPDLIHKVPLLHVPQHYVPEVKFLIRDNTDWMERRGERFPARLALEPERLERWRRWLDTRFPGRPSIGLSWRSKLRTRHRDQQYVTVEELASAIPAGSVAVNLQYSSTDEEKERLAELGHRFGFEFVTPEGVDLTDDLEDIFAILQVCDAAVTPMISLAWMAAAVGCPTYVFRSSRERMIWQQFGMPFVPWAPSMRLFFRDPSENWNAVVTDLRTRLEGFLANRQSSFA